MSKTRCAIYVRKSTEHGLDMEFNSLDNQEQACRAYIMSQTFQGWEFFKTYLDGGISGGTMARPGLQELLTDIRAGKIQCVLVYKIDRLSRSIYDFKRMMKKDFEPNNCNLVSITQSFDTSNAMGKLTLNMLLSFAEFEREVASEPKLLPFLNMPIQSGSPDVLTRMNRPYSLKLYLDIIDRLRIARPDIQISSDFIVGFPGETDADFEQTMEIARRVKYINSYTFKYSPRPHTAAALMTDQVPENIKKARLATLDGLLTEINRQFNESCMGKTMECLIEGPDKTGKYLLARSPYMQQVIVPNESDDKLQTIEITAANKCSLRGKLVKN